MFNNDTILIVFISVVNAQKMSHHHVFVSNSEIVYIL